MELNDLHCSSNIVRVIKSRRMRWVAYVAHTWKKRGVYGGIGGETWGIEVT